MMQSQHEFHFVKNFQEFGLGTLLKKSDSNTLRMANALRLTIFVTNHIDPRSERVKQSIYRLGTSNLANRARRVRDAYHLR